MILSFAENDHDPTSLLLPWGVPCAWMAYQGNPLGEEPVAVGTGECQRLARQGGVARSALPQPALLC